MYRRAVIKIGSNVLTQNDGLLNLARMRHLAEQVHELNARGCEVILVSSGAVAAGRGIISPAEKTDPVAARQLLAAVGQVKLMYNWATYFELNGRQAAQVLATKEDFKDRKHYLNMKACLEVMLKNKVIPVANENDVVAVTELMFTDNDELSGLIASMLNAEALILLTNVDGIYKDETIVTAIDGQSDLAGFIQPGKSVFGRGGMLTKYHIAQKTASMGIAVHIANGQKDGVLTGILDGTVEHTRFLPRRKVSGAKKWLGHSGDFAKGAVMLNVGAVEKLTSGQPASLLPVGVTEVMADFEKGDIIRLLGPHAKPVGIGIAEYGAVKAREWMGQKNHRPLVHYDYLYVNGI